MPDLLTVWMVREPVSIDALQLVRRKPDTAIENRGFRNEDEALDPHRAKCLPHECSGLILVFEQPRDMCCRSFSSTACQIGVKSAPRRLNSLLAISDASVIRSRNGALMAHTPAREQSTPSSLCARSSRAPACASNACAS